MLSEELKNKIVKKLAPLLLLVLILPVLADARGGSVHVKGYYRSNGTYVQPPSVSSYSALRQKVYRRAKQAVDSQTGCNSSGLNEAEIADCFRYALNKNSFDWEEADYTPPQPQIVSQPTPASAPTLSPVSQTASVISSYSATSQGQTLLILQLQLQIAALQRQLETLRRR